MTENKPNAFKSTSIVTNRVKSAVHPVAQMLALASPLLANTAKEAPDGFRRDTILLSYLAQRLLLLKNTMEHSRPC
jgi:hypothetical protein